MLIADTNKQPVSIEKSHKTPSKTITSASASEANSAFNFSSILKNQTNTSAQVSQKIDAMSMSPKINEQAIQPTTSAVSDTITLGSLSSKNTTVAQLLLNNPELKAKTWAIIHDPVNQNKAFNQIAAGKAIYYNPKTQELHWSDSKAPQLTNHALIGSELAMRSTIQTKQFSPSETGDRVVLGQINQANPTISNLLSQKSDYKTQRWTIIHSEVNKNKEFTKIPTDTTIYIDKKTKELSWKHNSQNNIAEQNNKKNILAQKLDDAVKPFMGTEYKNLDCYTLVVNGLENMGIRYRGKGSISSQLLQRAQLDGRSSHAYFTGEGLTEALGNKVYTKAITQIDNISQQSQSVFQEMKSLMKKGDILSFSLETRGHTGIISHNKEQWTYINSGRMDHSITNNVPRHGVGEESLLSEINNWIKLAQKNNEALKITVGRLDRQKFA